VRGQVLVFDLDDTLYLEQDFVLSGFEAVAVFLQRKGVEGFAEIATELFFQGQRGDIFDRALEEMGLDSSALNQKAVSVERLVGIYRDHKPSIALLPDARFALDQYQSGTKRALLSDGYRAVQQNKVDALGIQTDFQAIFLTDTWGRSCWKPAHCAYEKVELYFDVAGDNCLYISDNPSKDFIAPNQRGWDTIRVVRDKGIYRDAETAKGGEPRVIIESLYELSRIPQR